MEYFDINNNKIFFGSTDKLQEWGAEKFEHSKIIDKIKIMLKNYLELDNVSFLFGSGTSIHLGAVAIRNFPTEVEENIKKQDKECAGILNSFHTTIKSLQSDVLNYGSAKLNKETNTFQDDRGWTFSIDEDGLVRDSDTKEIAIEYEKVLNFLIALEYIYTQDKTSSSATLYTTLISTIKEGLFNACNLENRAVSASVIERKTKSSYKSDNNHADLLTNKSKYIFHEKFVKALLQRPLNLRRANIFTSNYDLAFEYAFDKLGVHYIDGFSGFHKRFFKPETFEYDIFYPGSTTSGKVQRIEKVVRYIKLHGSMSWVNSEARDANNLYGIEEKPLELIENLNKKGEIIIYPSAVKKSYTLDLPYSELFRQFATTITQSQSVLITVGYSFADEHFNDIIFQALSNPTFTLIIVDFTGTKSPYIREIMELNDPRIIILEGAFFGDFLTFSDLLMPNFNNIENYDRIANTLNSLLGNAKIQAEQTDSMPANTVEPAEQTNSVEGQTINPS